MSGILIELKGDRSTYNNTLRMLLGLMGNQNADLPLDAEDSYYMSNLIQSMLPNEIEPPRVQLSHFDNKTTSERLQD